MPWHIVEEHSECPASKPWALVKDSDGSVMGCHESKDKAEDQMAALHASEARARVAPIEFRSSTLTNVDTKQRLIDLIAVPWEQEAEIAWQGEIWREMFMRGSFKGIAAHAGRIRVNREHVQGDTVGKVVHFDEDHHDGLMARVKVVESPRGDETLALAKEDMVSPSVGFRINSHRDVDLNKRTKVRKIRRAFLDHLAMVESPAYAGAKVLAVRAEPSGLTVAEKLPLVAPSVDEALSDDLFEWAKARVEMIRLRSADLA